VLIFSAASPLAESRPTLAEIAEQPLVGFSDAHAVTQIVAGFRAEGLEPHWAYRSNDNPTIQGLVAAGVAVAVMPRLTVDVADPRIAVVDLPPSFPSRVVAIARHRDRYYSPAARALIDVARETVATRR
jgi:DNA-binding transcriptional LysR family regulator